MHKSKPITISAEAMKHFHKVKPIGIFSFLKYKGGTYATAPGTLINQQVNLHHLSQYGIHMLGYMVLISRLFQR